MRRAHHMKEIAKRMRDNDIGAVPVSANGRLWEFSRIGISPTAPSRTQQSQQDDGPRRHDKERPLLLTRR